MILFSKPNCPDIECRDGGQMEAAIAKGYERNMGNTPKPVEKVETVKDVPRETKEVDTPEAAYERKFGKAPDNRWSLDTLIKKLGE